MKCSACGKTNPLEDRFCGGCGVNLSQPQSVDSAPQNIEAKEYDTAQPTFDLEDAVVVRQSSWSYLLSAVPWIVLLGVSLAFDFFTFGILPAIFAAIFIGSRYMSFSKTAYIFTDDLLVIQQGSIFGQQSVTLPLVDLKDVKAQSGTLGTTLGYTRVLLHLKDGREVLLHFVPLSSPLVEHLQGRINDYLQSEEDPN